VGFAYELSTNKDPINITPRDRNKRTDASEMGGWQLDHSYGKYFIADTGRFLEVYHVTQNELYHFYF